jgi:anti-sigma regulatory factor (Ser/Thr protein kinase)
VPTEPASADRQLRLSLTAEPVSVPAARRFVADGLSSWGMDHLLDDATLCVSELAGNAALHSAASFMQVVLRGHAGSVTVSVEDDGTVPAQAVLPRPAFPGPDVPADLLLEDESTTGRGLAIVSILAAVWGVERTEQGKRVWCEITDSQEEHGVRPPLTQHDEHPEPTEQLLPADWVRVRLADCPVQLSLRQDQHLDEQVRELQLVGGDRSSPASQALAAQLQDLLSGPAHARHMGRRIAQQAAAEGRETIDVDMAMPRAFSAEVVKLELAVRQADVLCEEMRLLTVASAAELRALRAWMTEEIVRQAEHDAAPVPWREWVARRPS